MPLEQVQLGHDVTKSLGDNFLAAQFKKFLNFTLNTLKALVTNRFAMTKDSLASRASIQELFILAGYSPVVARTLDDLQLLKCVNDKWQ